MVEVLRVFNSVFKIASRPAESCKWGPKPRHMWFVRDICGIICAVLTWFLILYAQVVVLFVILIPIIDTLFGVANLVLFETLCFLAGVSHVRTMLTDPGVVPQGTATRDTVEGLNQQQMYFLRGGREYAQQLLCSNGSGRHQQSLPMLQQQQGEYGVAHSQQPQPLVYRCPKCCCIKPERAHHCSVCNRCIRKMDHHCPWVNNCIGENNQKFFVLFTLYIALVSAHALFLAIRHFVGCVHDEWRLCTQMRGSPAVTVVLLILLIFEALLFAIFTLVMFGSQIQAILSDETGIEQLKKEVVRWRRRSPWSSFRAVFGRFSPAWFSPFTSSTTTSNSLKSALLVNQQPMRFSNTAALSAYNGDVCTGGLEPCYAYPV